MFKAVVVDRVDENVIDEIIQIELNSFPKGWTFSDAKEYFSEVLKNEKSIRILLKENGVMVGYLLAVPHNKAKKDLENDDPLIQDDAFRYYIESIAILPAYQGKNGFSLMFAVLCQELKKIDIHKISMHARVSNRLSEIVQKRTNVTKIRRIGSWKYYNFEEPSDYIEADLFRFDMKFLDDYLGSKKIDTNRLSSLIRGQILYLLNLGSPDRVIEEIAHLEGSGSTETKSTDEFKGDVLKGFCKKHYSSSRFMAKNVQNYWEMNSNKSKKFEEMVFEVIEQYVKDGHSVDSDKPENIMLFNSMVAKKIVNDGYVKRSNLNNLTGEWIIFKKHEGTNYYLTVAGHSEKDEDILKRIESCKRDFPFLFP